MYRVFFVRHGQSKWNKKKLFTGWTDVDLTKKGIKEAVSAAYILKEENVDFDLAYTSFLKKAIRTLWIILDRMDLMWIPVEKTWRLNERFYGALQGRSKPKTAKKEGKKKVLMWRRSYDISPPPLKKDDSRYPGFYKKYSKFPERLLPVTESLEDVQKRVLPYWKKTVTPAVRSGKSVIIVSHGNCLRALVKYLDNLSNKQVIDLNIPTGIPFVYEFDNEFKTIKHNYFGDKKTIKKATEAVAKELD
jgi:2,3-bisphosphoglycerate-dependent phosphoglycerate mutase